MPLIYAKILEKKKRSIIILNDKNVIINIYVFLWRNENVCLNQTQPLNPT